MYGCVVFCTQNLAVSGANQVLLNLLEGGFAQNRPFVVSPSDGPLRRSFSSAGALVHVGSISDALIPLRDVRIVICNTVMTADTVLFLVEHRVPHLWILHEWWPKGVLESELMKRTISTEFISTIEMAMRRCQRIVVVCKSQGTIYPLTAPTSVIHVGVPKQLYHSRPDRIDSTATRFLCMGVVCPRKNQLKLVELFKQFAESRTDVTLDIVGARYVRDYETEYAHQVNSAIGDDSRIKLHPVTEDPCSWYNKSDVLLLFSRNEVTPLVICESMLSELPVITSDIAGIPEMLIDGVHGLLVSPDDEDGFVKALDRMASDPDARKRMGKASRLHALQKFTLDRMVKDYARLCRTLAPVTILVDMDGVIVDWDRGFMNEWKGRSPINRYKSYIMQECVPSEYKAEATLIARQPGFFASLPPCKGAIEAVKHLAQLPGINVLICSSPLLANPTCMQDKVDWIRNHFGPEWAEKLVLTRDKTTVRGDILIDDKPDICGSHHPTWTQAVFNHAYNEHLCPQRFKYRIHSWDNETEWKSTILRALQDVGHHMDEADLLFSSNQTTNVAGYRQQYKQWRLGSPKGSCDRALEKRRLEIESELLDLESSHNLLICDDFEEIFIFRKSYREWRQLSM